MILAIDQGTSGTTCMVFSDDGKVAGRMDGWRGRSQRTRNHSR